MRGGSIKAAGIFLKGILRKAFLYLNIYADKLDFLYLGLIIIVRWVDAFNFLNSAIRLWLCRYCLAESMILAVVSANGLLPCRAKTWARSVSLESG